MNERSIERVLLAASSVEVQSDTDACIVGGIVRSVIDRGHFDPRYAAHAASALMMMGKNACGPADGARRFPSTRPPTPARMGPLVLAFRNRYDPPSEVTA